MLCVKRLRWLCKSDIGHTAGGRREGIRAGWGREVIRVIWFVVESNLKTLKRTTLVS